MASVSLPILLVGSVPLPNAESVFRLCAKALGTLAPALPDGEIEGRQWWVIWLAFHCYHRHPAIETLRRPKPSPNLPPWVPSRNDDEWLFRVKEGVEEIYFESLGYAEDAAKSYEIFAQLKREGIIAPATRFQVSLPTTESAVRVFLRGENDFAVVAPALRAAMVREVAQIVKSIPPEELTIQWDSCVEVLAMEAGAGNVLFGWELPGDPLQRFTADLSELTAGIPAAVAVGLHLCYGDLGQRHFVQPKDLGILVGMTNAAGREIGRRIDYAHMPVPSERTDDAFFAPLGRLQLGEGVLYAGLIHGTDGVAGARRRLATLKRNYRGNIGIAAECGLGRRPLSTIASLLEIHREIATAA